MIKGYEDFTISILKPEHRSSFLVYASFGLEKAKGVVGDISFYKDALEDLSGPSKDPFEKERALRRLGECLFDIILPTGEPRDLFYDALSRSRDRGRGLRIGLHIMPKGLSVLPFEFLFDKVHGRFLATSPDTPVVRLTNTSGLTKPLYIERPLKVLVVVSNPIDLFRYNLPELNVTCEKKEILQEMGKAKRGDVEVTFLEVATLSEIYQRLKRGYHLLHLIGHGEIKDGERILILEDDLGYCKKTSMIEFGEAISGNNSLKLLILDVCESASGDGTEKDSSILKQLKGLACYIGMQGKIRDEASIVFFSEFYEAFFASFQVDYSVSLARKALISKFGLTSLDWGVPALFFDTSFEIIVKSWHGENANKEKRVHFEKLDSIPPLTPSFTGRRRELRELKNLLEDHETQIIIIHGMAGIGKTTLVSAILPIVSPDFASIFTIRCFLGLTIESLFADLNRFFKMNGEHSFDRTFGRSGFPLVSKVECLLRILRNKKFLLIFDNFEELLSEELKIKDKGIRLLFERLQVGNHISKVLLISRFKFHPSGFKYSRMVRSVRLGPLGYEESVKLMNRLGLTGIDLSTKEKVFHKTGGHPLALELFEASTEYFGVRDLLDVGELLKDKFFEDVLQRLYSTLQDRERELLDSCSAFRLPFSIFALKWLGLDVVGIKSLINRNLIKQDPETQTYSIHPIIKDFAFKQLKTHTKDQRHLFGKIAEYYHYSYNTSGLLKDGLEAAHFSFLAGQIDQFVKIVDSISPELCRSGEIDIMLDINLKVAMSCEGWDRALSLHRIGICYQAKGRPDEAKKYHLESLNFFKSIDAKHEIAATTHELGNVCLSLGEYEEAKRFYAESISLDKELNDLQAMAKTYHQIGTLLQKQENFFDSIKMYERSLDLAEMLGDKEGISATMSQLGLIYRSLGRSEDAFAIYEKSLKVLKDMGDRRGEALIKWAIGVLCQDLGRFEEAAVLYRESSETLFELGDLHNQAKVMHQLGTIYQAIGDFERATLLFEECLKIKKDLEDRLSYAQTLHQLGRVFHARGRYKEAIRNLRVALEIFVEMNSEFTEIARNNLNLIKEEIGEGEFGRFVSETRGQV